MDGFGSHFGVGRETEAYRECTRLAPEKTTLPRRPENCTVRRYALTGIVRWQWLRVLLPADGEKNKHIGMNVRFGTMSEVGTDHCGTSSTHFPHTRWWGQRAPNGEMRFCAPKKEMTLGRSFTPPNGGDEDGKRAQGTPTGRTGRWRGWWRPRTEG